MRSWRRCCGPPLRLLSSRRVATFNPSERATDGSHKLTMYATSQHQPPDTKHLVQEASDGLQALVEAMSDWMAGWPDALRDLDVPLFEEEAP
jgi:hypothetical protein